ncbi:MAG: hypothetical protein QOI35_3297, partial [Cryptosporangiaceae bacterium]|nr:hypothetical protein [Cryptosporangiaceae bacterium]
MADSGEQNGGEHKEQGSAGARPSRPVSRRRVLSWSLAGIAGAGLAAEGIGGLVNLARTAAASQGTAIWASLTRPQDQLDLRWELLNVIRYKAGEGPGDTSTARIAVADATQPAFLVVHFPPQNVAERAYFAVDPNFPTQQGDETALMAAPVPSMLAGESRLAFRLLPGADPIPFTPEGLLNWTGLVLNVVPAAARTINGRPGPQAPASSQTSIEAPWGLMLSPDDGAGWAHSLTPVTHGGRTELWHTRLGVRQNGGIDEADATHRTVRAVWTPGYDVAKVPTTGDPGPNPPGRTSLDPRTRYQIVRLSSDHSMDTVIARQVTPYQPRPIAVNRLMLSTLGAWVDTDGSWDVPMRPTNADLSFDVEEWLHKATMGRDNYVKVVVAGFLFPFGHRASFVTITERAFEPVRDANHPTSPPLAAVNRQRIFVVVREPERTYPDSLPN